jgi:hypothetical protein
VALLLLLLLLLLLVLLYYFLPFPPLVLSSLNDVLKTICVFLTTILVHSEKAVVLKALANLKKSRQPRFIQIAGLHTTTTLLE